MCFDETNNLMSGFKTDNLKFVEYWRHHIESRQIQQMSTCCTFLEVVEVSTSVDVHFTAFFITPKIKQVKKVKKNLLLRWFSNQPSFQQPSITEVGVKFLLKLKVDPIHNFFTNFETSQCGHFLYQHFRPGVKPIQFECIFGKVGKAKMGAKTDIKCGEL